MKSKRPVTPEEKKLWKLVIKDAVPLHKAEAEEMVEAAPRVDKRSRLMIPALPVQPQKAAKKQAPLRAGNLDAMDKNTAERFRKGDYPISATLDLHGMTYDKAAGALHRFIAHHYARQTRCVLIVTGKGAPGGGVLKKALPGWLDQDDTRPAILAFCPAQPKHGGGGAWYVLLKRKR